MKFFKHHAKLLSACGIVLLAVLVLTAIFARVAWGGNGVRIPVLLYHHLSENEPESGTVLHPDTFARHMELLKREGYTPITTDELLAFVDEGIALPDKPVLITFDDGYLSNYELAFPILREYHFPATIFIIGSSVGHKQYYKDTSYALTPHFGQEEIDEMLASGLISFGSHTYDMHQWAPFEETTPARETILPFEGESDEAYTTALTEDATEQAKLFAELGLQEPTVLAFPQGKHVALTDTVLRNCGYRITFTTDASEKNRVVADRPETLIDLGRLNIDETTTDADLLHYLEG